MLPPVLYLGLIFAELAPMPQGTRNRKSQSREVAEERGRGLVAQGPWGPKGPPLPASGGHESNPARALSSPGRQAVAVCVLQGGPMEGKGLGFLWEP